MQGCCVVQTYERFQLQHKPTVHQLHTATLNMLSLVGSTVPISWGLTKMTKMQVAEKNFWLTEYLERNKTSRQTDDIQIIFRTSTYCFWPVLMLHRTPTSHAAV